MADNTKGIGKSGGFFTSEGVLKSRKDLAAEDKSAKKVSTGANNQAAVKDISSAPSLLRQASKEVSRKTLKDVNKALENNAETKSDISDARKAVKSEIDNLKALKEKLISGTPAEVEVLRKKQDEAEKARAEVAARVEKNNRDRTLEGPVSIKAGNETLASFSPGKVSFSAGEKADLTSEESIDKAIKNKQAELDALKSQSDDNKAQRKEIAETAGRAIEKVRESFGESGIKDENEAEKVSLEVASAIKQGGTATVEAFNPKNINQQIVASLAS